MTFPALLLAASSAILPSDRMAMADRLFDRGAYAEAKVEYEALKGAEGIAADDILYRLAETARATGDVSRAHALYTDLLVHHPASRHADRARLMGALTDTEAAQRKALPLLDAPDVAADIRAAALYHLGVLNSDTDALDRCARVEPKGRYATAARFRRASLMAESKDPAVRRAAVGEFNELSFLADDKLRAREALYMAVRCSYADGRFAEAGPLARRYLKSAEADDKFREAVRHMAAWSFYQTGKWSVAAAFCGDSRSDEDDYLRAACVLASGDPAKARQMLEKYLEDHPDGRYRAAAELPLARLDFASASSGGDASLLVEAAKRGAELSKSSADRLRYAWALENAGRADEARAEYASVGRDFPKAEDGSEALFRQAMIAARAGRWSEAEMALAGALSGAPGKRKADALYWRGIAAHRLGHAAEGVVFLKEALETGLPLDESREARLLVADADFAAGRLEVAKESYAKLVREGACERLAASRIRRLGRFLLSAQGGSPRPQEAAMCGKALAEGAKTAEWRQAGWALKGAAEEADSLYPAAIASYRKALSEGAGQPTEDLPAAALSLGLLESRAGERAAADATLALAVKLAARDPASRVKAYLALAENAAADGRGEDAKRYATVVKTLFDDEAASAAADRILSSAGAGGAK